MDVASSGTSLYCCLRLYFSEKEEEIAKERIKT
jgi:hypothetical protein